MMRCAAANPTADDAPWLRPPIPLNGPASGDRPWCDDLFHEPGAHPKIVTTRVSPEVTVRDHPPHRGRPLLDTSRSASHRGRDPGSSPKGGLGSPRSPIADSR